jgi:hypothetical protein
MKTNRERIIQSSGQEIRLARALFLQPMGDENRKRSLHTTKNREYHTFG